jgi:hypothetical protein
MPLNILRLNHQKSSHPNDRIVFIKPLPRPPSDQASHDLADTFLRAIAAQCLPIMKNHHLSVTTLEEYEPNREFIGRNFNNGEIIQLVLRSKNGGWMPFNMVQMVMMHELAHNAHMNHGKNFWKTRNLYADEMKSLWAKGYTGEGFWGSGRTLSDMSAVMGNNVLSSEELEGLPLCGGTYRSRRKRKRKGGAGELTWKEKKQRRIEKKFGKNGVALGEDEDRRLHLEINRRGPVGGKPRVAQSKRGRELRAAAALARFETNKQELATMEKQEAEEEESDEDGDGDYEDVDVDQEDATDVNGKRILDSHGHGMIRVCEGDDTDDVDVRHELQELEGLQRYFKPVGRQPEVDDDEPRIPKSDTTGGSRHDTPDGHEEDGESTRYPPLSTTDAPLPIAKHNPSPPTPSTSTSLPVPSPAPAPPPPTTIEHKAGVTCPVCSLENPRLSATCMACSHVLDPRKDPRHWSCPRETCRDQNPLYLNAGDAGVCGICGVRP